MVGDDRRVRTGSLLLWMAAALLGFALLSKAWMAGNTLIVVGMLWPRPEDDIARVGET